MTKNEESLTDADAITFLGQQLQQCTTLKKFVETWRTTHGILRSAELEVMERPLTYPLDLQKTMRSQRTKLVRSFHNLLLSVPGEWAEVYCARFYDHRLPTPTLETVVDEVAAVKRGFVVGTLQFEFKFNVKHELTGMTDAIEKLKDVLKGFGMQITQIVVAIVCQLVLLFKTFGDWVATGCCLATIAALMPWCDFTSKAKELLMQAWEALRGGHQVDDIRYRMWRAFFGYLGAFLFLITSVFVLHTIPGGGNFNTFLLRARHIPFAVMGLKSIADYGAKIFQLVADYTVEMAYGVPVAPMDGYKAINDWMDDVAKHSTIAFFDELKTSVVATAKAESLHKEGLEHMRVLDALKIGRELRDSFNAHFLLVTRMMAEVRQSTAHKGALRKEPLLVQFVGHSGVGKSVLINLLNTEFAAARGARTPQQVAEKVYSRKTGQEFWDGYHSQTIINYDDFGAVKDNEMNPNPEFIEIIHTQNNAAYPLHMAGLLEKANTFFQGEVILLTSNKVRYSMPSLTHPDAVYRRIDYLVQVRVRPEFGKESTEEGRKIIRLDSSKVTPETCTDVWVFDILDPTSPNNPALQVGLSREELTAILLEADKKKLKINEMLFGVLRDHLETLHGEQQAWFTVDEEDVASQGRTDIYEFVTCPDVKLRRQFMEKMTTEETEHDTGAIHNTMNPFRPIWRAIVNGAHFKNPQTIHLDPTDIAGLRIPMDVKKKIEHFVTEPDNAKLAQVLLRMPSLFPRASCMSIPRNLYRPYVLTMISMADEEFPDTPDGNLAYMGLFVTRLLGFNAYIEGAYANEQGLDDRIAHHFTDTRVITASILKVDYCGDRKERPANGIIDTCVVAGLTLLRRVSAEMWSDLINATSDDHIAKMVRIDDNGLAQTEAIAAARRNCNVVLAAASFFTAFVWTWIGTKFIKFVYGRLKVFWAQEKEDDEDLDAELESNEDKTKGQAKKAVLESNDDKTRGVAKKTVLESNEDKTKGQARRGVVEAPIVSGYARLRQLASELPRKVTTTEIEAMGECLEDASLQAVLDQNGQNLVARLVALNQYKLETRHNGVWKHCVTVTFTEGRRALTVRHALWSIQVAEMVRLRSHRYPDGLEFFPEELGASGFTYDDPEQYQFRDLIVLEFPRRVIQHPSIIKHLADAKTFGDCAEIRKGVLVGFSPSETLISRVYFTSKIRSFNGTVTTPTPIGTATYYQLFTYDIETTPGDCGGVLMSLCKEQSKKIIGIHSIGLQNNSQTGASTPVSIECYQMLAARLDPGSGVSSPEINAKLTSTFESGEEEIDVLDHLDVDDEATKADPIMKKAVRKFFSIIPAKLIGGMVSYGYVDDGSYQPPKTNIHKSPIYGMIREPTTKPAHLKVVRIGEKLVNPKALAREKVRITPSVIPADILHECTEDYLDLLESIPTNRKRVLTYEEAIKGIEGDDYVEPLNRKSSPGWPWMRQKEDGKQGKRTWLGENDEWITDEPTLKAAVQERIEAASRMERTETLWVDTLKDERRPHAKVDAGKTRLFSVGPIDFNLAFRMYFGMFLAFLNENRITVESCVGVNPYSLEWTTLARKVMRFGKRSQLAGDYTNYDGRLQADGLWAVLDIINTWYNDGNDEIRYTLWAEIVNSDHMTDIMVDGERKWALYSWNQSQPSGNPGTVNINSVYNSIFCRLVYLIVAGRYKPEMADMKCFNQNVSTFNYGDDNLWTIHEDIRDWFNMTNITAGFKLIGMEYTDESKSTNSEFRSIDDISFLKRRFLWNDRQQRFMAPLSLDTVLEMPMWVRGTRGVDELTSSNLELAAYELALHGKMIFDKWMPVLKEASRKAELDPRPIFLTYERYLAREYVRYVAPDSFLFEGEMWPNTELDEALNRQPRIFNMAAQLTQRKASEGMEVTTPVVLASPESRENLTGRSQSGSSNVVNLPDTLTRSGEERVWRRLQALRGGNQDKKQELTYCGNCLRGFVESRMAIEHRERTLYGPVDCCRADHDIVIPAKYKGKDVDVCFCGQCRRGMVVDKLIDEVDAIQGIHCSTQGAFGGAQIEHVEEILQFEDLGDVNEEQLPALSDTDVTGGRVKELRDHSVVDFLSRTYLANHLTWATANPVLTELGGVALPEQFLTMTPIKEKLSKFRFWRPGRMTVKVQANAQPFQQGILLIYAAPMTFETDIPGGYPTSMQTFQGITGYPHVLLNLAETQSASLTLPFVSPQTQLNVTSRNLNQWFVRIVVYAQLKSGEDIGLTVWVKADDVTTDVPTGVSMVGMLQSSMAEEVITGAVNTVKNGIKTAGKLTRFNQNVQSEEAKQTEGGTISKITGVVSNVAGAASMVPGLSTLAAPVALVSGAASKIASLFGWSKPISESLTEPLQQSLARQGGNFDGSDLSKTLALSAQNQIGVQPIFGSANDEMSIANIVGRFGYFDRFNWNTADTPGTELWSYAVTPLNLEDVATYNAYATNLLGYTSLAFQFWRGTLKYRFHLSKTASMHTGRLVVSLVPSGLADDGTMAAFDPNACYRKVVDLAECTSFEVEVPYFCSRPWTAVEDYGVKTNPSERTVINISVLNPLRRPSTIAADNIDLIVEVAAGDDFELAAPTYPQVYPLYQNDGAPTPPPTEELVGQLQAGWSLDQDQQQVSPVDTLVPTMTSNTDVREYTMGERVASVKQLWLQQRNLITNYVPTDGTATVVDPFAFNTASTTSQAQLPLVNTKVQTRGTNYFDYFAPLFAYWRGSGLVKIWLSKLKEGATSNNTSANFWLNVCYNQLLGMPQPVETTISELPYSGTSEQFSGTNFQRYWILKEGVAEIRLPFYSTTVMKPSRFFKWAAPDATARVSGGRNTAVIGNLTGSVSYDIYGSVADDFAAGLLIGPPLIRLYQEPV